MNYGYVILESEIRKAINAVGLDYSRMAQYYLKFLEDTNYSLQQDYTSQQVRQFSVLLESEENDIVMLASINEDEIQKNISVCFMWIGLILNTLGQYSKSLFYHNRALKMDTKLGDEVGLGKDHSNIGNALSNMRRIEDARRSYNMGLDVLRD